MDCADRMDRPASFKIDKSGGSTRVALSGDWTALGLGRAGGRLASALKGVEGAEIDAADLGRFDSVAESHTAEGSLGRRPAPGLCRRRQAQD
jgi:hypothetical protein